MKIIDQVVTRCRQQGKTHIENTQPLIGEFPALQRKLWLSVDIGSLKMAKQNKYLVEVLDNFSEPKFIKYVRSWWKWIGPVVQSTRSELKTLLEPQTQTDGLSKKS